MSFLIFVAFFFKWIRMKLQQTIWCSFFFWCVFRRSTRRCLVRSAIQMSPLCRELGLVRMHATGKTVLRCFQRLIEINLLSKLWHTNSRRHLFVFATFFFSISSPLLVPRNPFVFARGIALTFIKCMPSALVHCATTIQLNRKDNFICVSSRRWNYICVSIKHRRAFIVCASCVHWVCRMRRLFANDSHCTRCECISFPMCDFPSSQSIVNGGHVYFNLVRFIDIVE